MLYNSNFTKSERKLKEIETEERNEQDSDSDLGTDAGSTLYPQIENRSPPKVQIRLQKDNNEDDALIEIGTNPGSSTARESNDDDKKSTASKSGILDKVVPGILKKKLHLGDKDPEANKDDKSSNWKDKIGLQKLIPDKFQRSVSNDGSLSEEKRRQKEAKKAEKEKFREVRRQRKIELKRQAEIERQRKNIADAIELMLQCLRSICALAILTGNIRRHFAPVTGFENLNNSAYNDPEVLMVFTITTSLDIFLFSLMLFLNYFKQCRLCCRLGVCKFWIWAVILVSLMFGTMLKPMHYIHKQLDPTWCVFMPGTDLADYLG